MKAPACPKAHSSSQPRCRCTTDIKRGKEGNCMPPPGKRNNYFYNARKKLKSLKMYDIFLYFDLISSEQIRNSFAINPQIVVQVSATATPPSPPAGATSSRSSTPPTPPPTASPTPSGPRPTGGSGQTRRARRQRQQSWRRFWTSEIAFYVWKIYFWLREYILFSR